MILLYFFKGVPIILVEYDQKLSENSNVNIRLFLVAGKLGVSKYTANRILFDLYSRFLTKVNSQ